MNLKQLQTSIRVAESDSFAEAARKEYLSSSALIQQIQSLEKELQFTLFNRSPSGIRLTEAGKHFYEGLSPALNSFDQLVASCQSIAYSHENTLTIGFPHENQPRYTHMAVTFFRKRCPQINVNYVRTSFDHVLEAVRNCDLDLCEYAYTESIKENGLLFDEFRSSPRWCLLEVNSNLSTKSVLRREDLLGHRVAMHDFRWNPELVRWCQEEPPINLIQAPCTNQTVYELCLSGGIYLMPKVSINLFSDLKAIPLEPEFVTRYGFVYRKDCSHVVRQFLHVIKEIPLEQ